MLPEDRLLGHYRLVRRIGGGGMGEVYLAEDTRINRQVAIKVVRTEIEPYPDPATTQDTQRLFQREMRAITMLDHPHILPLFDFGEQKDGNIILTYMVMPYRVEGSLTDWLHKRGETRKLTPNEVAHFVMQAADALQHAHDHHLIHQDVKPSNFLVRNRSTNMLPDLLLMDFGISRINTATSTASQNIRGTPAFMAPEQWEGEPQPATDQYALAVMAYLLLTGRPPFSGRMEQVMRQHFMLHPQPTGELSLAITPALDAVILRALEKQPDKRFPSILEFAQAFQQALQPIGNQEPIVLAPKNGEIFAVPDDVTELKKISLADSAPLPSTVHAKKSDNLAPTVATSNPDLFAQAPTVANTNIESPNSETPKPLLASRASERVSITKKWNRQTQVLAALIILIIISSIVGVSIYQNHVNQVNASATASAYNATSQAKDNATSTARTNETATAQTQATATALVIVDNPYPSYLSGHGTLAFVDPLSQEGKWVSRHDSTGGACQFTGGAYHVSEQQNYTHYCDASETFSNFAFEVQLRITQGNCGGMIFREGRNGQLYHFSVCQNGNYKLTKYASHNGTDASNLRSSSSSAINTGLNQENKIAVVASGSTIILYINERRIDQIQDSTYTSGSIGLSAAPQSDVAYNNARVWTL